MASHRKKRRSAIFGSMGIEDFANAVNAKASELGTHRRFGVFSPGRVYIAFVWATMRLEAVRASEDDDFPTLTHFKELLISARRAGLVRLARNDMVDAALDLGLADQHLLQQSTISRDRNGSEAQLIVVE